MTQIVVARHAEPTKNDEAPHANWPLSPFGRNQADYLGERVEGFGFTQIISAPVLRCKETAEIVAKRLGVPVKIDPRFGALVPPKNTQDVYGWLSKNFGYQEARHWNELDANINKWRDDNLKGIKEIQQSALVITQLVNINAIMGAALRLDTTMCCRPAYASLTRFLVVNGDIRLVMEDGTEIKGPNE